MAYASPQLSIFQNFQQALAAGATPLYSVIMGANYALHRFSDPDEKAEMGPYNFNLNEDFAWPDHVAGGLIDLANAEIWIQDTLMRYFQGTVSNGGSGNVIADNSNKVESLLVFATNAAANRDVAAFGTRDVQPGDACKLSWIDGISKTLWTEVASLDADVLPGSASPPEDPFRENGFPLTSIAVHATELTAPPATSYTGTYSGASYDGLADGYPQDVYKIQVIQKGTGGAGGLEGTILRITSDGNDLLQETELTAGNYVGPHYAIALGSRGATATIEDNGNAADLLDSWTVEVGQTYVETDVTDTGQWEALGDPNFTGQRNTKYIITVVEGGEVGVQDITIQYSTVNGEDQSGNLTVLAADFGVPTEVEYPIGIRDVKLKFVKNTQLNTGGQWSFVMEGEAAGAIHTLVLRDQVPVVTAIDLDIELFVQQTREFPVDFLTLTQDLISVDQDAEVSDDLLGTPDDYAIFGGTLYASYRELLTANTLQLGSISDIDQVDNVLGPSVQHNPLSLGVYKSLENSNGIATFYIAVASDDLAGYQDALDILTDSDDIHGIVPLTNDRSVHDAVHAHVLDRSTPEKNQWRIGWYPSLEQKVAPVYTQTSGGADILATVDEFPIVGVYKKVTSTNGLFVTNGVQPGDLLRINFDLDAQGDPIYTEVVIDYVASETEAVLLNDFGSPQGVAMKIEIWKNRSNTAYALALSQEPARYNHRRAYMVYADNPLFTDGGVEETLALFYVAAALAGQRAGAPPHAPLSQVSLLGVPMDPRVKFSRDQLLVMGGGGLWIINKNFEGNVFTIHQLSTVTDEDNFIEREQSKTTNLDDISRTFYAGMSDLFGQGNVSPEMLNLLNQRAQSLIEEISNRPYAAKIGPQMLGAVVKSIRINELLRDTINVEIDPAMPDPLNQLPIVFTVT